MNMRWLKKFANNPLSVVGSTQISPTALRDLFFMKHIPWYWNTFLISEEWDVFRLTKELAYIPANTYTNKQTKYRFINVPWKKARTIHRLVAKTYLPNPNNYPVVRHLDNNKLNNHISNLEWCTQKTNIKQAFDDWLNKITKKQIERLIKRNSERVKPVIQFDKEWNIIREFKSVREAQNNTWIREGCISNCATWRKCHATAWGFIWKYI